MMKELLDFYERLEFDDIPSEVIAQARRCFLDWVGVTLGGMAHPATGLMIETLLDLGGAEQASILGTAAKTSMHHAALINGTASHVLDYDDTHLGALLHPSVTIIPAVLALGESRHASGRDVLLAYLTGFEIETRISIAMGAMHYDIGWHATATMGRFGAAAASAKLLGLDRKQTANALGLAGTQASGLRKVFGTMTKSFHPGKAAADGLLSALLAAKGFTSSEDILIGDKGLGALLSPDYYPTRALAGLGSVYNIMGISIKPFASCLYTHPVIDGMIYLRDRYGLTPERVKRILCRVSKFCADAACQKNPQTGLAGKFSTYYCAALALADGRAGESDFAQ
jgi:2-methylcitrate dehydratase PrpD